MSDDDPIITNAMLREQDLARIDGLERECQHMARTICALNRALPSAHARIEQLTGRPFSDRMYAAMEAKSAHNQERIAELEAERNALKAETERLRKAAARISMAAALIAVQDNSDANLDAVELRAALAEIDAARGAK